MTFDDLQKYIRDYCPKDKAQIINAYEHACWVHRNQVRKSGEPYIIHPLYVGCLLAEMNADADTICAGLLHDVIEDGESENIIKISEIFNPTVAQLVDGVTKINKIVFDNDKLKADAANTRKIIESLITDVRIFIIKLADRLHNMMTLEYQSPAKQYEIAKETMELFVPFASLLGEFKVKSQLEDLSFKYMNPDEFTRIQEESQKLFKERSLERDKVNVSISQYLNTNDIPFHVLPGEKNVYSIYKKLLEYGTNDISNLQNLMELKFMFYDLKHIKEILNIIDSMYVSVPSKFKNYIENPKLNMYKALHTTIISPCGYSLQIQLQTCDMYKINTYGLTAYWDMLNYSQDAVDVMQTEARRLPFIDTIKELSNSGISDEEFNNEVRECILTKKITVQNLRRDQFYLPINATVADYIIKYTSLPFNVEFVAVNGIKVPYNHKLNDGDIINVHYLDHNNGIDYEPFFNTCHGKRLYLENK